MIFLINDKLTILDSRVFLQISTKNVDGLVPYSASIIFDYQSYSFVHVFNSPVNFWNAEAHCYIVVTNSSNMHVKQFLSLMFCVCSALVIEAKKFFDKTQIRLTCDCFKHNSTNIFPSFQCSSGVLMRATIR